METGTGSLEALREANRVRVVDALRREGSASRTDLVKLTGLSRTTDHHAGRRPAVARAGHRGRQRRATAASAPARAPARAAAARAAGRRGRGRRLRAQPRPRRRGRPVARPCWPSAGSSSTSTTLPPTALDTAADLVDEALREAGVTARPGGRRGHGPAGADRPPHRHGRLLRDPAGWAGVKAGRGAGAPARHARRGRQRRQPRRAGRVLARRRPRRSRTSSTSRSSSGIGAGLVLGGRLHRGATRHRRRDRPRQVRADGAVCRCGNRGCLETVAVRRRRC